MESKTGNAESNFFLRFKHPQLSVNDVFNLKREIVCAFCLQYRP